MKKIKRFFGNLGFVFGWFLFHVVLFVPRFLFFLPWNLSQQDHQKPNRYFYWSGRTLNDDGPFIEEVWACFAMTIICLGFLGGIVALILTIIIAMPYRLQVLIITLIFVLCVVAIRYYLKKRI